MNSLMEFLQTESIHPHALRPHRSVARGILPVLALASLACACKPTQSHSGADRVAV